MDPREPCIRQTRQHRWVWLTSIRSMIKWIIRSRTLVTLIEENSLGITRMRGSHLVAQAYRNLVEIASKLARLTTIIKRRNHSSKNLIMPEANKSKNSSCCTSRRITSIHKRGRCPPPWSSISLQWSHYEARTLRLETRAIAICPIILALTKDIVVSLRMHPGRHFLSVSKPRPQSIHGPRHPSSQSQLWAS